MGGKVHACKEGRKWREPPLGTIYSLISKEWIKYIEMLNESHALHKTSLDIENMLLLINKENVDSSGQSQWSILFTKHFISLPCRQIIYSLRGKGRDLHTRSKIKTLFPQKYFILDLPPFSGFPSALSSIWRVNPRAETVFYWFLSSYCLLENLAYSEYP